MKIIGTTNDERYEFDSLAAAADWLILRGNKKAFNTHTKYIRYAINQQTEYCGYLWSEELPKLEVRGHNANYSIHHSSDEKVCRTPVQTLNDDEELREKMQTLNAAIRTERAIAFENALGMQNVVFKLLPHYYREDDVRRLIGETIPFYNMYVDTGESVFGINDVGELAILLKINIDYNDMQDLKNGSIRGMTVHISENYKEELKEYARRFVS